MQEIQLQKPNTNIFCYAEVRTEGGKIIFDCEIVEYNPETEDNEYLYKKTLDIFEFTNWMKENNWIVC